MDSTLLSESQMLQQCLDPSTRAPLIKLLNDTLTLTHAEALLKHPNFRTLIDSSRVADLQLMHQRAVVHAVLTEGVLVIKGGSYIVPISSGGVQWSVTAGGAVGRGSMSRRKRKSVLICSTVRYG